MLDLLASLRDARVLVIGDVMLDRYVEGKVDRISPEAPVPVLNVQREYTMPGGAANVAANIAALGGRAILVSVIGADPAGYELQARMRQYTRIESHLIMDPERTTTVKARYVAGQHMLRADGEDAEPISRETEKQLCKTIWALYGWYESIVISDYAKGVLWGPVIQNLWPHFTSSAPVVVDPKGEEWDRYQGAYLLTPNEAEWRAVYLASCQYICQNVLVTRGRRGMTLMMKDGNIDIPQQPVAIADITGAGDTVAAVMGACAAVHGDLELSARLANVAARIVVQKPGTAVARPDEIRAEIEGQSKIASMESVLERVARWKREGLTIGFANGCFDLLHAGHIHLLTEARKHCDRLVVAINSDESVRRLKGDGKPIETLTDRMIKVMFHCDVAVAFPEDTPEHLLHAIRPDVLIKGAEYEGQDIAGAKHAGRVVLVQMLEGKGTTGIIERIRDQA